MMVAGDIWTPLLEACFWVGLLLPLYSYVVYPLIIYLLTRLIRSGNDGTAAVPQDVPLPGVAVVVSAYNEAAHVAALLETLGQLDYPPEAIRFYVGSDGSTDGTAEILQRHASDRVQVFAYRVNRGKASVLNDLIAATTEPIVLFTDANTALDRQALRRVVQRFADPAVGVVCGELMLRSSGTGDNVDGIYWRLEHLLKAGESAIGGLLGANGAIYAIRRHLYVPLPANTIVDDFCISMTIAARGWRMVYEPLAQAVEEIPPQISDEFTRRVRIGIGNYQAFFRHPEYLFRVGPVRAWTYVSHKVVRWFTPHFLLLAVISNALLAARPAYAPLLAIQLIGYGLVAVLCLLGLRRTVARPLRVPIFLAAMNAAFVVAFYRYVTGHYSGSWKRTARA